MLHKVIIEELVTKYQVGYRGPRAVKYSYKTKAEMPTQSFLQKLKPQPTLFPNNTKYHVSYQNDNIHIFVTEYEPAMRHITIHNNQFKKWQVFLNWCDRKKIKDGKECFERMDVKSCYADYIFEVLTPYIVMVSFINMEEQEFRLFPFMRPSPLTTLDDDVYKLPLYNITTRQTACMGSTFARTDVFAQPVNGIVNDLYSYFWASEFNTDYNYNIVAYRYRQIFNNYFIWEYQSKHNPMKIFKTKYVKYAPLHSVIKFMENQYSHRDLSWSRIKGFFPE